ncbi:MULTISPECIES: polysaccharide deacetylase family protein [Candidatus Cryosericum]|jgi:hypothetical protein|uniref:DUF7033 domain-containing protein n=2 Tax=Candidatus Cryosericum TaxID=2498709 RepID=A0A398DLA1_9BACT|nr:MULTISPECIES: polysaccharide deacetylase family protein [Cryosericum]RIE08134.1 hypothetical protein SMC5_08495 [Candidatus Cryosericum odellii]RIE11895.1 hypothetical protein SMC2_08295 [Candidatus Cryosericum hinesii]RIE11964.1 hypothetical protein SMC3_08060 [Candidatus Cryosericum hinesii]
MITRVRYSVGNVGHPRAAQYALHTLLEMVVSPDCLVQGTAAAERREDEVLVTYGVAPEGIDSGVHVFVSGFFDGHYGSIDAMPERPVIRMENIPALYRDDRGSGDTFYSVQREAQGTRVDCHVDVVAGAFFMLSRYEETVVPAVDVFDRFPAESSVAFQEGFLQEPIVNQYAEQLLKMLRVAGFTGEQRRWWGTAPWAIALTHDIDQLHRFACGKPPAHAIVRSATGRGSTMDRMVFRDYVQTMTHRKADEYDCLSEMAAWEVSIGVRSAYYFLADNAGQYGADYAVDAPGVVAVMKTMGSMGHEVGFHAGFNAYENAERFHNELSRLQSIGLPIVGGRQHYLRWQTPTTWRLWEAEGLAYDATLGYSKAAGFRCGSCLPFHPYDIESDREMSIFEWPLMFMDATYLSAWSEGTKVLDRVSQECRRCGGVLVLLWHNRNWSKLYVPAVRHYMQELLKQRITQGVLVSSISGLTRLVDAVLADHV